MEIQDRVKYLFMDGKLVPFKDARIHPLNTTMKFGASVFDAWRGYWNSEREELYLFRLREHLERLLRSAKIFQIASPFGIEDLLEQSKELVRANQYREDLHCRIILFINQIDGGLFSTEPVSTLVAAMPMHRPVFTTSEKDSVKGVHCSVSSWRRISDEDMPPRAKAASNYMNSRLAGLQALSDGYDSAILLDRNGKVSEGPAYCIFLVRDGVVLTPPVTSGVLESVTRDSLLTLSEEVNGRPVIQREIDRTELYATDEAFFCGSSAEVTPILSVDRRTVGDGKMGPITERIRRAYIGLVRGKAKSHSEWLVPVYGASGS